MAIVGSEETIREISSQVETQFPGFVREDGPQFVAFLEAYYEYMEQQGNAVNVARSIRDNLDIDRTVDSFVEYFRKEFMLNIPKSVLVDKRLLAKHIREFYRSRGSLKSYQFLFRILFDSEVEIYYPGDDILRASDGRWVKESRLRLSSPFSINPSNLIDKSIRGITSGARAYVEDTFVSESGGLTIYDLVISDVRGVFVNGERIVDDSNTDNYATVSSVIGPITTIDIIDGGAFHNTGDVVEITGAGSTSPASGIITEVNNKNGVQAKIYRGGGGYTKENTRIIITGGNGTGFSIQIPESGFVRTTTSIASINTDLIGPMKDVPLNAPVFFVKNGANTATVRSKLIGKVSVSSGSNTVTGVNTKFDTQLNVGDLVRVQGVANTLRVHTISSNVSFIAAFRPLQTVSTADAYIKLAAANVYSVLNHALYFTSTEFYTINTISILDIGYEYTSLPTVKIVDDLLSSLNIDDGAGGIYGNNAVVSVSQASGSISKIKLTSGGSDFNVYKNATITNTSKGVSTYNDVVSGYSQSTNVIRNRTYSGTGKGNPSGFVQIPGRYTDTKGFLSWNNKLQDNDYYQEFSYVIRVDEFLSKYSSVVKSLLHPAGTKMFGEYQIFSSANVGQGFVDGEPSTVRRSVREIIVSSTEQNAVFVANANITESATAIDTPISTFVANTNITESATATAAHTGTFIANTRVTESVTTTAAHTATFTADGRVTESVTTTESVVSTFTANTRITESAASAATHTATFTANTRITESVTTTASEVGVKLQLLQNVYVKVLNANSTITPYSGTSIGTYSTVTVDTFDGTPRLVRTAQGTSYYANGTFKANTGSISVGGTGTVLYIVEVPNQPIESTSTYQVNAIFSNTIFSLRTNYSPTTANARIWYSA